MRYSLLLGLLYLWRKRRNRKRRWYVRPVNITRLALGQYHELVAELRNRDPEYYYKYFRMYPSRFDDLLGRVEPYLQHKPTHRFPVSPAERLALTLRLLATGDCQQSLAFSYRLGLSTVNTIFRETCKAIWTALKEEFLARPDCMAYREIVHGFWILWNFPLCLGAIDGKHVKLKAPPGTGSKFFNYKGYHSVVLMAACDANYCFTFVDVGGYGRQSDGGTFRHSQFGDAILNDEIRAPPANKLPGTDVIVPHVFLADEAFPLCHNIMRPYPGKNLIPSRRIFNYRLSRARRTIENAFGIMSSRWRIFQKPIECKPETADSIILACVALHNYLKMTDTANPPLCRYVPPNFVDYTDANGNEIPGQWRLITASDSGFVDRVPLVQITTQGVPPLCAMRSQTSLCQTKARFLGSKTVCEFPLSEIEKRSEMTC